MPTAQIAKNIIVESEDEPASSPSVFLNTHKNKKKIYSRPLDESLGKENQKK